MKIHRIAALSLSLVLAFSLAACGQGASSASSASSSAASSAAAESKTEEQLLAEENEILSANDALWEKVFSSMDKNVTETTISANYGDFLLKTIENAKDQFTEEELKVLREGGEKIRDLEDQLTKLEEKFPELMPETPDGTVSVPAENGKPIEQNSNPFPAFEGKDLDGNPVKSDELFSANAVTVVNFWFTTCNPCVGELSELESLHQELTKKGGGVVGINSFTLGGDEAAISEAKSVLSKKGVTYPNVYFPAQGEAGKFVENVFAYPTTYVVDRSGNVVGDPIVGAITDKTQAATLQKLIDQALAADMG